jgi:hypothetical protein
MSTDGSILFEITFGNLMRGFCGCLFKPATVVGQMCCRGQVATRRSVSSPPIAAGLEREPSTQPASDQLRARLL